MTDQSWLQRNLFVVAAICLPLLLAAFFILAQMLPGRFVDGPSYDLIFSTPSPDRDYPFSTRVRAGDGELIVELRQLDYRGLQPGLDLFRYDAVADATVPIEYEVPAELLAYFAQLEAVEDRLASSRTTPVQPANVVMRQFSLPISAETPARAVLYTRPVAEDGYRFESGYHRVPGGVFGELFGMRRGYSVARLTNKGRIIELQSSQLDQYPYVYASFVAWVEWQHPTI